jgi:hypothetical protein
MGREVRRVRKDWQHPVDRDGRLKPLFDGYETAAADWLKMLAEKGLQPAIDYYGGAPDKNEYMPEWTEAEADHLMMYETCSEGTPLSPAFKTAEELARWLADNKASAFGDQTATYEQWLGTIRQGFAFSAAIVGGKMVSGVSLNEEKNDDQ